jgi:4-amino-4-deoxy-L-arabinose transferase-like glycosyltransferase
MLKKLNLWMYAFVCIHILAWTLLPALVRYNLPLDAMEGTSWGHQFEWGYDKNPFMSAWITACAINLGGHSDWIVYLCSQLSIGICFLAVWQLGKKILPPTYAFIAVLLLEGIQYYNFHAIDLSDNTLEVGFWALTILFFYKSVHEKTLSSWILTGLCAGMSMMTKYYTIVLLIPMLIYLLAYKETRDNFKRLPIYTGLIIFLLLITPHVIWLFSHDFMTVNYAFNRVSSPPALSAHVLFPAKFTLQMIQAIMPACFLFAALILCATHQSITEDKQKFSIANTDKTFLLLIGLGPFILTVLLSAITGIKLRSGWGQPLFSLWGIILLVYIKPLISTKQLYRFMSLLAVIMMSSLAGYYIALTLAYKPSSANYPGREIANTVTKIWHEKYHTPVSYVAGARWLAGNISLYSPDSPYVYIDWNNKISSWVDENKLKQTGAVFVWDLAENDNVSIKEIKKRFPTMAAPQLMEWLRNNKMEAVKILVTYLPPG